jgi:hypothetical protein
MSVVHCVGWPWHGACRMSPAGPFHVACRSACGLLHLARCTRLCMLHVARCMLSVTSRTLHAA